MARSDLFVFALDVSIKSGTKAINLTNTNNVWFVATTKQNRFLIKSERCCRLCWPSFAYSKVLDTLYSETFGRKETSSSDVANGNRLLTST